MSLLPLDNNVNPSRTLFAKYTGEPTLTFSTLTGVSTINGSSSFGSSSTGPTGAAGPVGQVGANGAVTGTGATGPTGANGFASLGTVTYITPSAPVKPKNNYTALPLGGGGVSLVAGKTYLMSFNCIYAIGNALAPAPFSGPLPGDCVGLSINTNTGGTTFVGNQTTVTQSEIPSLIWQSGAYLYYNNSNAMNLTCTITPVVTQTLSQIYCYAFLQNGSPATYTFTLLNYTITNLN
jgi:hypothetical protein